MSRVETVAVAALTAIRDSPYGHTKGACRTCGCPEHAGHKVDCPIGAATRALTMIETLRAMGV